MNVLIVTFGNNLCQKYNYDVLSKELTLHGDSCTRFDILESEREMLFSRFNSRKQDYHDLFRSYVVNKRKSSTDNTLKDCIINSEIDVIICLHNTAVTYIESAVKHIERRMLVYSVVIDTKASLNISDAVDRYVVFTRIDFERLESIGVNASQILQCKLFCSSSQLETNVARKKLNMCLDGKIVVFVTYGKDERFVIDFIENFVTLKFSNVNLIVLCKTNSNLSNKINIKFSKYSNIGSLFCSDKENLHIAAADFVVADTNTDDCISAILNNKPLIVHENSVDDKSLLKIFNGKRYLVSEKTAELLSRQLLYTLTDTNVKNNYIMWQKELLEITSEDVLYNDIINNLYTQKKGENNE